MRFYLPLTIALLLIFPSLSLVAQEKDSAQATETGLALEILFHEDGAPAYNPISRERLSGGWFTRFRRLAGWRLPEGELPVRAVNILSRLDKELVTINVSVLRGARFHDEENSVGVYQLRENESISVKELERFGIEPFHLKVVRINPLLFSQPIVESRAKSLVVAGIVPINSSPPSFKLTLQNISDKNISAFELNVIDADGLLESGWLGQKDDSTLIAAGEFFQSRKQFVIRAEPTAAGYAPALPGSQQIVISCVLFEDGSYEGDAKEAAEFRALRLGRKLALARLLAVLTKLDGNSTDTTELQDEVKRFRQDALSVSETADESSIKTWEREFPNLDQAAKDGSREGIEVGIHFLKRDLLAELDALTKSPSFDKSTFRQWASKTESRYRTWLSRL